MMMTSGITIQNLLHQYIVGEIFGKDMKHYNLIFVLLMFFCNSCIYTEDENHHYTISFYNNTDTDLYVIDAEDYPDTTATHLGMLCQDELYKVKAHSLNRDALVQRTTYESIFNDKKRGNIDTLMVFVFDAEKLDTIESDVHVNNAILVRYDLSRECRLNCVKAPYL